jgi:hypothetical protein
VFVKRKFTESHHRPTLVTAVIALTDRRTSAAPQFSGFFRWHFFRSSVGMLDRMALQSQPFRSNLEDADALLRRQLVASFHDERVHVGFEKIFTGIPADLRNVKPTGQPFTLWQLLVHLRLCVIDFLDACRIPGYVEPPAPEGFWPAGNSVADDAAWEGILQGYQTAMQELETLILDSSTDLFSPIPGNNGRTILRQALGCLDHNAYHLGQALLLRRMLGIWAD